MTHSTRHGVFETNSSSSHSLTVTPRDLSIPPFPESVLEAGVVTVSPGQYGWTYERFYTAQNKISYLMTQVLDEHNSYDADDDFKATLHDLSGAERMAHLQMLHPELERMARVVAMHTGCQLELGDLNDFYIDHQSVGNATELLEDDEALANFLFSHTSYIETGNDNQDPPEEIDTDLGYREPYENVVAARRRPKL